MAAILTNALVVPQWDSQNFVFYTPGTSAAAPGAAELNPNFTFDQTTLAPLFENTQSYPNACMIHGTDLYVSLTSHGSAYAAGIVKLPGYLANPSAAFAGAFVINEDGNDYTGLAMDAAGNLYAAAGEAYPNNSIYRYNGAATATSGVDKFNLGNAQSDPDAQSYFGDLVFDAYGNLWAPDYYNNRLVVFEANSLTGAGVATWLALENSATNAALPIGSGIDADYPPTVATLFVAPEGADFDSFDPATANLWVGNNNDPATGAVQQTENTTMVKIRPAMLQKLLTKLKTLPAGTGATVSIDSFTANSDYFIYPFPNYPANYGSSQKPQFGGIQIDKSTGWLYVNDETNAPSNGWIRGYQLAAIPDLPNTPADTSSALISNNVTSQLGNGGMALLQLGAYLSDGATDLGQQPDTTNPTSWESSSIVLSVTEPTGTFVLPGALPLGTALLAPTDEQGLQNAVTEGFTAFVYVNVNNFSPTPTNGLEELHLYWAKASAGLAWPGNWNGSTTAAAAGGGTPLPAGGLIGKVTISPIPGSGAQIYAFAWTPPNPADYADQDQGHFCLLARVVTPNANYAESSDADSTLSAYAGMSFPETANCATNVLQNARVAQTNIHILDVGGLVPPGDPGFSPFPITHIPINFLVNAVGGAGSNKRSIVTRLSFTALHPVAAEIAPPPGRLRLRLTEASREVILRTPLGGTVIGEHLEISEFLGGIGGIELEHGQTLPLLLEYQPGDLTEGSALRVSQYAGEQLVGGQTYVFTGIKRKDFFL